MPTGTIISEFKSDAGLFYKITIKENDATSDYTISDVTLSARGFDLSYKTDDKNRFTGLIPSELQWDIFIESDVNEALLTAKILQIRQAPYKKFQVLVERGVDRASYVTWWAGNVLNDINPEKDDSRPTMVTLTASCGLAQLSEIPFNDNTPYNFAQYKNIQIIRNALINDIGTHFAWGATNTFIRTSVDWTTSDMTRAQNRDPLEQSKFNIMVFREFDEDTNEFKYEDGFTVLDNICKIWGMRGFLSDGKFQFIQVNNYDFAQTTAPFFRDYYKDSLEPDASGTLTSLNLSQDSLSYLHRLNGATFDYLPILRNAIATYDHQSGFDFDWVSITNGLGATNPPNYANEIVAWNGLVSSAGVNTSAIYGGINNESNTDMMTVNLGDVFAPTGSNLKFKRTFYMTNSDGPIQFTTGGVADPDYVQQILARIYIRFKIVGTSNTHYAPFLGLNTISEWTTDNTQFGAPTDIIHAFNSAPANSSGFQMDLTAVNIEFVTSQLPENGTLHLELYSRCYQGYILWIANDYDDSELTEITEATTNVEKDEILIFSPPEDTDEDGIFTQIDGANTLLQVYEALNQPDGTTITNGTEYDVGTIFAGTAGDENSIADMKVFDGTNFISAGSKWRSYANTTNLAMGSLLVDEILQGQVKGAQIFNGSIKNTSTNSFEYWNGVEVDSIYYVPHQCTFNGERDTWSGEWYESSADSTNINRDDKIKEDKGKDPKPPKKTGWAHN